MGPNFRNRKDRISKVFFKITKFKIEGDGIEKFLLSWNGGGGRNKNKGDRGAGVKHQFFSGSVYRRGTTLKDKPAAQAPEKPCFMSNQPEKGVDLAHPPLSPPPFFLHLSQNQ